MKPARTTTSIATSPMRSSRIARGASPRTLALDEEARSREFELSIRHDRESSLILLQYCAAAASLHMHVRA
jgi:hypothetical protein